MNDVHTRMMLKALEKAREAVGVGEVPIGAVVYKADGTILAEAHNLVETNRDATAHAEFLAAKAAVQKAGDMYLTDAYVAVTLEPCAMCAQALSWMRVKGIYFGAYDPKSGGTENGARVLHHAHHKPDVVGGLCEADCATLLQDFFKQRR